MKLLLGCSLIGMCYNEHMKKGLKKIAFILVWMLVIPVFVVGQVSFWQNISPLITVVNASSLGPDQGAISDVNSNISDVKKKLDKTTAALAKDQANLGKIQQSVGVTQKKISTTKAVITDTVVNISRKEQEIKNLNDQIALQQEVLKTFLQQAYYVQSKPTLNVLLSDENFSDLLSGSEHLSTLDGKIVSIISDINLKKSQVDQDKAQLAQAKQQNEQVLGATVATQQGLLADQADTQKSIADKQKSIDKLKKELSQLQGDLSTLLGKSYSAKNIMDAVSFASDKTGVPKGFLIGVLKMETNLGANVGGCTYGEVESGAQASYKAGKLGKTAWATFQSRRDTFKGICKELGIDYQKQKVSCNPKGYTGTGGAMGVAQFMPDTWNAYKSQVASITGNNPPSPWDLGDGVTAMALKLARVPGVTAGKTSAYKTAACAYLGTCYAPYINGILYWADNYKDLLN